MHHRSHDQVGLCLGGSLSKGSLSGGVSVQEGGSLSRRGVSVQGGLCLGGLYPGGFLPTGVSVWRVSVRETPVR